MFDNNVAVHIENDPKACGLDLETGEFDPSVLIQLVNDVGPIIYLTGAAKTAFETIMHGITDDKDGFDDGYTKNIYTRSEQILNGTYFENIIKAVAGDRVIKQSSSIFSINKGFESEPDFKLADWKDRKGNTVVGKDLEAKNLADIEYFSAKKVHNSLYTIVNSRATSEIYLLCKARKDEEVISAVLHDGYKVINLWFWLKALEKHYDDYGLGNSWQVRPVKDTIEIISPKAVECFNQID